MMGEEARLCGAIDEPPFKPSKEAIEEFGWAARINRPERWGSEESVVTRNKDFDASRGDFRDRGSSKPRVMHFPRSPVDQIDELARSELEKYREMASEKGKSWLGPV